MVNLFVAVHLSKAKLTLYHDCNCNSIASTVSAKSCQKLLPRVIADSSTISSPNDFYDPHQSTYEISLYEISGKTKFNLRSWIHLSGWNSKVWKTLAASLECFGSNCRQYGLTKMSNMIFLCKLTFETPKLPSIFVTANAVSSTVELVNAVTSASVNSCRFVTGLFTNKGFPIEVDACSDAGRRVPSQTLDLTPSMLDL